MEHVAYRKTPFCFRVGQRADINCNCLVAKSVISDAFLNNFISGFRLITPVPEQGASNKILSNGILFHQVSTSQMSAASKLGSKRSLFAVALTFSSLLLLISIDKRDLIFGCCSRIWHVLPPGAQHASRTNCPLFISKRGAANWAASSWTLTAPSPKLGTVSIGIGSMMRIPTGLYFVLIDLIESLSNVFR